MRSPIPFLPAVALCSALLAPLSAAGVLNVPAPYPTIQNAIDAALPGDTILVNGGTYAPIIIDLPLTIIGTSPVIIDNTEKFPFTAPFISPAIRLAGPGSGAVVLAGITTQGVADGSWYGASASGILGGGFSQLYIQDCTIQPAEWGDITGLAFGKDAIDVSVPLVHIMRSTVTGGRTLIDACDFFADLPPSGAGVRAPSSTVVSLSSIIIGGQGGDLCFTDPWCPTLGPSLGAVGGAGVIADCLFAQWDFPTAFVSGGLGGDVTCGAAFLGSQPQGQDWVVNAYKQMPMTLMADANSEIHPGGTLDLTLAGPAQWGGFPKFILVGVPAPPLNLYSDGYLFMDPSTMNLRLTPLAGGPFSINIPNDPSLIGLHIALQFYSPLSKLTDPYITVVEP